MAVTLARSARPVLRGGRVGGPRNEWRSAGRRFFAATLTTALVAGAIVGTGGVADAVSPAAQSEGRFLGGTVLGGDLAGLLSVAPATASAPPATTDVEPLTATALSAVTVGLGGSVNLLGSNGILTLGAVNQYATAAPDGSSQASSGAVGNDGAIAIGADGNAQPGIAPASAKLDLADVIADVPALQTALSGAVVQVGAVAAAADQTAAGVQSGAYKIGSLSLDVTSPLIKNVYATVSSTLGTVQGTLNGLQATLGPLVTVNGIPTLTSLLAPLTAITSADGSITANLQTGAVHIDIRKITGLDLDNLAPNTNLVPAITLALTTQLLPAITKALTGAGGVVQTATSELNGITVTTAGTTVPLTAGQLTPLLSALTDPITALVAGLGTSVLTPLANALTGLLALTGNVEPALPNAGPTYVKRALSIGVVPTADAAVVNLASASVGPNAGAAPTIAAANGLSPDHGSTAGGTTVTVTGTGFVVGATTVNIDGISRTATVTDATHLTFTTPAHPVAGPVDVTVQTARGTSTPAQTFTYLSVPTIASVNGLSPDHGPIAGGTKVTVTGTGFFPGDTTVNIDGISRTATVISDSSLTFITPAHAAGQVGVTVTNSVGTSTPAQPFTYGPPTIAISGLSPASGSVAGGTTVTVTGTGFVPGATTVNIDGISRTATVTGTTSLTFVTPVHAVAGPVDVTVQTAAGLSSPAQTFTYVGTPTATSLTPNSGAAAGGDTVTVTGTGFIPGDTTVTIGGVSVPATVVSSTSLTFVTPPHTDGQVGVTVTTGSGTTAPALPFTYGPPHALTLAPDHGPAAGGTPVTITGSGFVGGHTSVTIGGVVVPAGSVTVSADGTSALFSSPAHAAGGVLVTATTPQGTTAPLGYLYGVTVLPVTSCFLTGIDPSTGLNAATVSVLANVGIDTSLVPSTFAIKVGTTTRGSIPVVPLLGGFLQASISVPVPVGTTSVSYGLTPLVAGVYPPVSGAPIACTDISPAQKAAGAYHPLPPYRLLDTRSGNGSSQPIGPGGSLKVKVQGLGGVPAIGQPAGKGVATVMLNVTTTNSAKAGYLTIYPGGTRPNASSINFPGMSTVANLVAAAVGADGTVTIYNGSAGVTDVVADVQGYFSDGPTVAPGSFVPLSPSRILDTSTGNGAPKAPVASGKSITIKVAGVGGVPATNVAAVALNMTVAEATGIGYITVYPTEPKPFVSSLNFNKGDTDANLVIVPVAPDGTVTIYNGSNGSARLIADVSGYFRGGTAILDGEFVPVSPGRILDTRVGNNASGKVPSQTSIAPTVLGRNRIPATGVSAIVSNLTVTSTKGPGFITAYPANPLPLASNLNFVANQNRPNAVIGRVGSDGKIRLFNGSGLPVDLVMDVSGYFISNPIVN